MNPTCRNMHVHSRQYSPAATADLTLAPESTRAPGSPVEPKVQKTSRNAITLPTSMAVVTGTWRGDTPLICGVAGRGGGFMAATGSMRRSASSVTAAPEKSSTTLPDRA